LRKLTWRHAFQRRLARHHLLRSAPREGLVDVVSAVCGIHAQIMPAGELSIAARVEEADRTAVRGELWERRTLVKTYGLRGTVHVIPADELSLWMSALRALMPWTTDPKRLDFAGMTPQQHADVLEAIGGALDGQQLERAALYEEVAKRVGPWVNEPTGEAFGGRPFPPITWALGNAAWTGRLCFGPNRGNKVTFVRPDQWYAGWRELDTGSALTEVFRRYLRAYGPATSRDFAQWFNITPAHGRSIADGVGDELEEVDVDGYRALLLRGEDEITESMEIDSVRLLPHFDVYVVGGFPRDELIPPAVQEAGAKRGKQRALLAGPSAVLLIDGRVAGVWKRTRKGKRVHIDVEPYVTVSKTRLAAVGAEAKRIGAALQAEAVLSVL
jgi:hypothetical protein